MSTATSALMSPEDLGTEMVTILVDSRKHDFEFRKNILLKKLPYFEDKFPPGSSFNIFEFPNADPEAFEILFRWVYGADVEIEKPKSLQENHAATTPTFRNTIKLYGLAEKLSSHELMDDTMTALFPIARLIGVPDFKDIKLSYAVTHPWSPLRSLMAGCFAWRLIFAAKEEARCAMEEKLGLMKVDPEWLTASEDFWALAAEVDGLGKDMFSWLYDFANNPTAPVDRAVCFYHHHADHASHRSLGCEKYPALEESCLYPYIVMNYEKCTGGLPRLEPENESSVLLYD